MRFAVIIAMAWMVAALSDVHALQTAEIKVKTLTENHLKSVCSECKVDVSVKWMPDRLAKQDSGSIQFITFPAGLPRGYQNATVHYVEGENNLKADVQLYIQILQYIPVASKRLLSGESVTEDKVVFQWKDITKMRILPAATLADIQNQVTGKIIKQGSVFFYRDFVNTPVIKAGKPVDLVYQETGFKIHIRCLARESKAKGESIRLYSRETGKTYIGKVISQSKAIWEQTL